MEAFATPGRILVVLILTLALGLLRSAAAPHTLPVGVAAVDITPDYPIRLSGFGFRRTESEGVTLKIWAKAFAIGDEKNGPAIIVTVDNLGVSDQITSEVAERLGKKIGLKRERFTLTATHTHTAPMLRDVCPTLFGVAIPPEHQAHIDQYTREFTDNIEKVALAAFKDIRPAEVAWGVGEVGFAANRRTKGGPVDHDLPVLVARDPDGKVRAVYFSYACHCVTLSDNKVSGDWAGFAQKRVQDLYPDAVALASVGCGADSNPSSGVTGANTTVCEDQGRQVADEVQRVVSTGLTPITDRPEIHYTRVDLPLAKARTREEWEERAKRNDAIGYHARVNLERLDGGEAVPTKLNYPVQSWVFGDQLAIVFMPGETVVDYALRLKSEYDHTRLWLNGYANDSRCYIPSERILMEGGYEGGEAQIYYDAPQFFAAGVEEKLVATVRAQLPAGYKAKPGTEGVAPQSPEKALKTFQTKRGLKVELVASEPQVQSPVAIDWGADGKLWVCEMNDYPMGMDGNWKPGGRVKFLEDRDGDGRYETAITFIEQLPFPTGITAWGRGVLICAAPDIIYAEDTNGDGKADKIEKLFTGFFTDNYQARVNSLHIGLDNWIYGANGLLGGVIEPVANSRFPRADFAIDIRNRDFRFDPVTGAFEMVSGITQQGRVRDDWDNWFGNNNSLALMSYPYPDRYFARNPNAPAPDPIRVMPQGPDANRIYPTSKLLHRFNDPDAANRVTSGCGLGIYRDTWLGAEFYGNAFTCEPVHNLVHREVMAPDLSSSHRADDEQKSEFLTSSDNWFRPVQARTGPDGALYIVDMYRFLIEHPRWIPAARLAQIDVRAGSDKGRIYRVVKEGAAPRAIRDLTILTPPELARALNSPNGTERDRVHVQLLQDRPASAIAELHNLVGGAELPQVRVQAMSVVAALEKNGADAETIARALRDKDEHVRAFAIRLAEPLVKQGNADIILAAVNDESPVVARQLAFSLGESEDRRAADALIALEKKWGKNTDIAHAIVSSAKPLTRPSKNTRIASRPKQPSTPARRPASSGREPVLEKYKNVATLKGSAEQGADVFAKNCAACHQLNGVGFSVGPDLAPLRSKDADYWVKNILDPNAVIEPRFVSYNIDLEDDRSLSGIIGVETANAMTIVSGGGQTTTVSRNDVVDIRASNLSLMPEGLEAAISPQDMADLIAYARTGVSRKIVHGNKPSPVTPDAEGIVMLPASKAEIYGNEITYEEPFQNIGMWHGDDDYVVWTVHLHEDHAYDVYLDYASAAGASGNKIQLTVGGQTLKSNIATTGSDWSAYKQAHVGRITIPGGIQRVTFRSDGPVRGALLDLRAIAFAPSGKKPQWPNAPRAEHEVLRDAPAVARFILDAKQNDAAREKAIQINPQFAAKLIGEMTRDLSGNSKEEYARIPWIWRVAIACGKRNDAAQIAATLDMALPQPNEPLRHWQAVVIGGGIINGVSQRDLWPGDCINEILKSREALKARWTRTLELAQQMTDDESVPTGTRYDALRMIALLPWEQTGKQLARYLAKGTNAELQMGAVSGLVDMKFPQAAKVIVNALSDLEPANRNLAIEGLSRDPARILAALDAIDAGKLSRDIFSQEKITALKSNADAAVRSRAAAIFK